MQIFPLQCRIYACNSSRGKIKPSHEPGFAPHKTGITNPYRARKCFGNSLKAGVFVAYWQIMEKGLLHNYNFLYINVGREVDVPNQSSIQAFDCVTNWLHLHRNEGAGIYVLPHNNNDNLSMYIIKIVLSDDKKKLSKCIYTCATKVHLPKSLTHKSASFQNRSNSHNNYVEWGRFSSVCYKVHPTIDSGHDNRYIFRITHEQSCARANEFIVEKSILLCLYSSIYMHSTKPDSQNESI